MLLNFKSPTESDFYDHPDMLPHRVSIREIRGKLVWQTNGINIGLPISHIRDLGQNKTRFLLVIIVSTAPLRRERRDAIRQTWWKHCRVKEVSDFFRLISFLNCLLREHKENEYDEKDPGEGLDL